MLTVIVDGANVVGSRPDGWWRDRAGAATRLAERLDGVLGADSGALTRALDIADGTPLRVVLVLEGAARSAAPRTADRQLRVLRAETDGDTAIAALARDLTATGEEVVVVTADRGLRARVHVSGARTVGPGALLRALDPTST
ncbi:hypothetical protein PA7_04800 [Pseudonocardia asaccharolytica DSM 44247 = NBRC 16224]|uniref:NTP pyrophosphohydrolase n=2 Tax=Pseudonocardia asaccharolytica TaxID=54010 RepID=A0A511CWM3_9PSEU|nr:hypothetical protein PA7_04800 [Pseudonocardia asaccharolytica DSM 44247 = NBRC 16224]